MTRFFACRLLCVLSGGCLLAAGCKERAAPEAERAARAASAEVPAAREASRSGDLSTATGTIEQLRIWRAQRRYSEIEPYIDPAERFHFIDTLVAADQVLDANAQAMRAIAELWGEHRVAAWNLAMLGDHLGLFSADIVIVREDVIDDEATVTYQVSGVVPLEDARLRRIDGRWVYLPGHASAAFPRAMQQLARTLSEVAEAIRRLRLSPERIHQEYRLRVVPRLRAVEKAGAATTDVAPESADAHSTQP
jgi:hypothetical protein